MSTSKHIDKICIVAITLTLVLTILFMCKVSSGTASAAKPMKYENTLFDTSYVHRIDIVMDDWNTFIENCESEDYSSCTVVIDGNKHNNIAIRAKGNTSLSNVRDMGSKRYSFKLEFDHYEAGKNYDGLDKLCLNNLIQDNTMMKDYLVYRMMNDFNVSSPLCSFAFITVNGEDWGLYLAVESVEDSFLSRNYGSNAGELYKPDSMGFGGGRGNGKDFNMDKLNFEGFGEQNNTETVPEQRGNMPQMRGSNGQQGELPQMPGGNNQQFSFSQMPGGMGRGFGRGMGSDDVKLKYSGDDPDSYSNIFDSAKTDITPADKKRLISALKNLSEHSNLEGTLDMDEVLRYFVVHNFVSNGDSYTGSMIHNYYLHEKDGKLGMIPWDYNLAFGTFQAGRPPGTADTSMDRPFNPDNTTIDEPFNPDNTFTDSPSDPINASIDSPVSDGNIDDRPMVSWIFSDETYTNQYHQLFSEFIEKWCTNGELDLMIANTAELLKPYVEKDPTKFCTIEDFEKGVSALSKFVTLRAEAVNRQLHGDYASVDTADLNLSDMGTMNRGMGGRMDRNFDFSSLGKSDEPGDSHPGENINFDSRIREIPGSPSGTSDTTKWILVVISFLLLAAGLFVASKKKC